MTRATNSLQYVARGVYSIDGTVYTDLSINKPLQTIQKMSKFWAADSDESSSDSSSDDSSSSSDSSVANKAGDNRWVMDSDSGTFSIVVVLICVWYFGWSCVLLLGCLLYMMA